MGFAYCLSIRGAVSGICGDNVSSQAGLKDRQTRQLPRAPKPEEPKGSITAKQNLIVTEFCRPSMQLNYICLSYFQILIVTVTAVSFLWSTTLSL